LNNGIKILLLPFAYLYGIITLLRNRLYDWHVLKQKTFDVHTIGVGNLAVGGAGKTPLVEYLIRLLLKEEPKIATLSRGYKRKTRGYLLADETSTAEDIGDEPLIYKSKYPVLVAVDGNRAHAIKNLSTLDSKAPKIILLDDAFQHRSIKCGLSIVVTDYHNLFFKDFMLPSGTLREFKGGIHRADIIIVSKTPERTSPVEIRTIIKDINPKAHQQVFFSYLKYGELYSISNVHDKISTLNDLYRFNIISFAGIANAEPMVNYLKEYAADVRHLKFDDHHEFSLKDLEDIERYYNSFQGGNKLLVTTEKDLMRLKNNAVWRVAERMNIYILPVEVTFNDKEAEFNAAILKYVRTKSLGHSSFTTRPI
jgi:tetraacyldisaccharide 4'-kinase